MAGKPYKGVKGVRLNPQQSERTRSAIATSQIINRLNAFVLSQNDPQTDKPVEMSQGQVTAAVALLKKVLPDLSSVDGNMTHNHVSHDDALSEIEQVIAAAESAHGLPN
jgi:hypothetical protein